MKGKKFTFKIAGNYVNFKDSTASKIPFEFSACEFQALFDKRSPSYYPYIHRNKYSNLNFNQINHATINFPFFASDNNKRRFFSSFM
jgi:hypothetical protein